MLRELWRRRSVRILIFLVASLIALQYLVNFLGYYSLPDLVVAQLRETGLIPTTAISVKYADDGDGRSFTRFLKSPSVNDDDDDDQNDKSTRGVTCPPFPRNLLGTVRVSKKTLELDAVNAKYAKFLQAGGFYTPPDCQASQKVAVVIPFRDREPHLVIFLNHLIPMLIRQQIEFTIYVVDQALGSKFNRGMLMNIGFAEALKDKNYFCFIFHDVDLLPENDHNIYSCSKKSPRHMSAAVDKFDYKLPYAAIFGGVSAIKRAHFLHLNGFSNAYFGWGAEDDDMYRRIKRQGLKLTRYPLTIARYTMLSHGHEGNKAAKDRFTWLNGKGAERRLAFDGVNSLKYKTVVKQRNPLYTRVVVEIDQKVIRADLEKNLGKMRWWPG